MKSKQRIKTQPEVSQLKFVFLYVTCPKLSAAKKIAHFAIKEKVAACANIFPKMQSLYKWRGNLQTDNEVVLILKTKRILFSKAKKLIAKHHPYQCPCIVALPLVQGNKEYLQWLHQELS